MVLSSITSVNKSQPSAFVVQNNNNRKIFNRGPNPNLKCKKCNMIGHTIERYYEVVGYPLCFKKRMNNQTGVKGVVNNNSFCDQSSTGSLSVSLSNEQMM